MIEFTSRLVRYFDDRVDEDTLCVRNWAYAEFKSMACDWLMERMLEGKDFQILVDLWFMEEAEAALNQACLNAWME